VLGSSRCRRRVSSLHNCLCGLPGAWSETRDYLWALSLGMFVEVVPPVTSVQGSPYQMGSNWAW